MKMIRHFLTGAFCLLGPHVLWGEVRILPIVNASLTGGGSSLDGQKTDFEGSARAEILPVVELNDRHAILPTLRGSYSGTQNAVSILDEQTLFQQEQDYQAELGWLYRFAPTWKLITNGGGTWTYLRETKDEGWRQGLYNHHSAYGNLTVEKRWPQIQRPVTLRAGVEISQMLFPNYESLSAQSGNPLPGRKTLDMNAGQSFLEVESSLAQRLRGEGRVSFGVENYRDQMVLDASGNFTDQKRHDKIFLARFRLDKGISPWHLGRSAIEPTFSLGARGAGRASNQNEFDQGRLVEDYYSYQEAGLTASADFYFRESGIDFSLSLDSVGRLYPHRPAQNSDASFRSEDLKTTSSVASFRFTAPLWKNLRATLGADRVWATSNTEYEQIFNYQYTSFSYFAGLAYGY
ncbi:MAG: hypothetical protein IPN90_03100 [Elusimicrobia bacterium]|nr:hypothetical protein [Elusimicrobiota bacterium]